MISVIRGLSFPSHTGIVVLPCQSADVFSSETTRLKNAVRHSAEFSILTSTASLLHHQDLPLPWLHLLQRSPGFFDGDRMNRTVGGLELRNGRMAEVPVEISPK